MMEEPTYNLLPTLTPDDFLPAISRWQTLGGIALLCIFGGGFALAATLPYKITVKAPVVVRPKGDLRLVEAAIDGIIGRIVVQNHNTLRQGDVLAYLVDDELRSQEQQLQVELNQTRQQLVQIQQQLAALNDQTAAETQATDRTIAATGARLESAQRTYQDQQTITRTDVREAEAAVRFAKEELNRYQRLVETGVFPELKLKEKEAALETALARLERTQALLNPSSSVVTQVQEEVAQSRANRKSVLAKLAQEKTQLSQQQTELQKQQQATAQRLQQVRLNLTKLTLRAPTAGTIQELSLRNPGQVVKTGEVVALIAPSQAALTIQAWVDQDAVSKIRVNQPVNLRIDSCIYTDYGTLPSYISNISPDAKTGDQMVTKTGSYYEVEITPQRQELRNGKRTCLLKAGMQGQAYVITQEETILIAWLRKLRLITDL